MPSDLLQSDICFPEFQDTSSSDEKLNTVLNYLYMLREQLRYSMSNLSADNFNDSAIDELKLEIAKPIYAQIEDLNGNYSSLRLDADAMALQIGNLQNDSAGIWASLDEEAATIAAIVSKNNGGYTANAEFILSAINGQSTAYLSADRINFEGSQIMLSTVNQRAYITMTNGNLMIDSENFTLTNAGNVYSYGYIMLIGDGESEISFADGSNNLVGSLSYTYRSSLQDYALYLQSYNGNPLKLYGSGNISIDVNPNNTIYIGTIGNETITLGSSSGRVNLVGDVYVNGTKIS